FGLASRIAARLGEVSLALQQIGDLRKQIDARKKDAIDNAELQKALRGLEEKVEAAVEPDSDADFGLFGLASPGKENEPLPEVAGALTRLLLIVDSSDLGPAADAAMASERWEEAAQETLARWSAFQKDDLAAVNAFLERAKLKMLVISPVIQGDAP